MKIFLAWSGEASKSLAQLLHRWLPDVIQSLQPFMSEEDIRSGRRWLSEIGKQLAQTNFAILCATPDSLGSPWMHFEAGAAAKDVEQGQVCALLVDLQLSALALPLSQFQNRTATDKADMLRLLQDLNKGLPEGQRLEPERLNRLFEKSWPEFEKGLEIVRGLIRAQAGRQPQKKRDMDEILEALLAAQQGGVARLDALEAQFVQLRGALLTAPTFGGPFRPFTRVGNLTLPSYVTTQQGEYGRPGDMFTYVSAKTEAATPAITVVEPRSETPDREKGGPK